MKAVRAAMIALLCLIPLSKGRPLVSAYGSFSLLILKGLPVERVHDYHRTWEVYLLTQAEKGMGGEITWTCQIL